MVEDGGISPKAEEVEAALVVVMDVLVDEGSPTSTPPMEEVVSLDTMAAEPTDVLSIGTLLGDDCSVEVEIGVEVGVEFDGEFDGE